MSIAWATVVIVVLLLPGFAFFWGLYAPNQITREVSPTSPLAQLAGVVIISFFVHTAAYGFINSLRTGNPPSTAQEERAGKRTGIPYIEFDELTALLRIDGVTPAGKAAHSFREMFDRFAFWILGYFGATAVVSGFIGFSFGRSIANGHLSSFTRHRYLYIVDEGRKSSNAGKAALLRAHVLSNTSHDKHVIIYHGVVRDFFAKADGTISYIALHAAYSSVLVIGEKGPEHAPDSIPLDRGTSSRGEEPFLVITSENIANVYFERFNEVESDRSAEQELTQKLATREGPMPTSESAINPSDTPTQPKVAQPTKG